MNTALLVIAGALLASCIYLFRQLGRANGHFQALQQKYYALQEARNLLMGHAYFDQLTGLANRTLLQDRFQLAVERAKRAQAPFALVMIDLNNFKAINDDFGHLAGDQVLVAVSQRLTQSVRASDTVARFGGDEFVLIVEAIEQGIDFSIMSAKLINTLNQSVKLESGNTVNVGASIGFALYPTDGATITEMLAVADRAMYKFKSSRVMPLFE